MAAVGDDGLLEQAGRRAGRPGHWQTCAAASPCRCDAHVAVDQHTAVALDQDGREVVEHHHKAPYVRPQLGAQLDGARYELGPGDSITYSSTTPHWYRNTGTDVVKAVWIITPPTF